MTNPLDDLTQQPTLPPTSAPAPAPARQHTSGRRESRRDFYARGITIRHQSPTKKVEDEKLAIAKTGMPSSVTAPIKRKAGEEKRGGMTKKEWKRARREAREKSDGA